MSFTVQRVTAVAPLDFMEGVSGASDRRGIPRLYEGGEDVKGSLSTLPQKIKENT
jgi:hypothetical protein